MTTGGENWMTVDTGAGARDADGAGYVTCPVGGAAHSVYTVRIGHQSAAAPRLSILFLLATWRSSGSGQAER